MELAFLTFSTLVLGGILGHLGIIKWSNLAFRPNPVIVIPLGILLIGAFIILGKDLLF